MCGFSTKTLLIFLKYIFELLLNTALLASSSVYQQNFRCWANALSNDPGKVDTNFFCYAGIGAFLTQECSHFNTENAQTYMKAVYVIKCIYTSLWKGVFWC